MKKLIVIIVVIAGIYYFMSDSENESDSQDQSILLDNSALKALEDAKQLAENAADRADSLNKKTLDELVSDQERPKVQRKWIPPEPRPQANLNPSGGFGNPVSDEEKALVQELTAPKSHAKPRDLKPVDSRDKPKSD